MSTRERWIVYPLLFLTLGIVMRDKVCEIARPTVHAREDELVAGTIRCGRLEIAQDIRIGVGRPAVVLSTDPRTNGGVIETLSPSGMPLVRLQPADDGGVVLAKEFGFLVPAAPRAPTKPPKKRPANGSETGAAKDGK
jgi:hypothetical protein